MRASSAAAGLTAVAAVLLALPPVSATAASAGPRAAQIEVVRSSNAYVVVESSGHPVVCPSNEVLLDRAHVGDENGWTIYRCGSVFIGGTRVQVSAPKWSAPQMESDSVFTAGAGEVLVGRSHEEDEQGPTRYATATMTVSGRPVQLASPGRRTEWQPESVSNFLAMPGEVMVGRQHEGDENGGTRHLYAKVLAG
ncbi:hypothetical protein V2W30_39245 [Streptomyces sp. Q6]|uniref:Uncharacterized protein n=1 Tax=Streptomyces citrinus TaxID=3118173 RepID=A0ACD5AP23_9ACTN